MLKFLCGPSGSGKSAAITQAICRDIENGVRCYLLVPEQQAYISERDLPKKLPKNAGLYFKIVNFSGLCQDVFQTFGGLTQLSADRATRSIIMWETLRKLSGTLKHYNRTTVSDTAFTENILAEIEELQNNGIESNVLENAANALPVNSPLANKLLDIAWIQATYTMLLQERFGGTPSDQLIQLAKVLQENTFFTNTNFYIDSFTSFTMPEYEVLKQIIRQSATVTVGLCLDSLTNPGIHFRGIRETAKKLKKSADLVDVPVTVEFLGAENNCRPEVLRILERDLWKFELTEQDRQISASIETDCVSIYACPNIYEESHTAALNILALIQQGMHFGDIVIYVRTPETYRGVLDAALEHYQIPYFISERAELTAKPLAKLLLSALHAVDKNFRTQDIITLVKTGLCGINDRDAALFEDYCETWHISGTRFCDDVWNMNPDGLVLERTPRGDEILETANRVRSTVITPLKKLSADFRQSSRLSDRCRAIYDYLVNIHLAQQLTELAENELNLGQVREAGESLRLYQLVQNSLAKLCQLLPDATVTVAEMLSLLEILFSHSDLGSVPNVHDCVTIGSAATVRAEGVQAAFLLGLCEGEFPKSVQEHGILSEMDKKALKQLGIDLGSDMESKSSEELFYVYRAVTKPLQKLYLSYPVVDSSGMLKTQSLAMSRVCFLLDRKPKDVDLGSIFQNNLENTTKRLQEEYVTPSPAGTSLYLSKTKINTFQKCPYSYFCNYTLRLREQKDSATTYADDGKFLHYIFQKFLENMLDQNGTLQIPQSDEEMEAIVSEIVLEYLGAIFPFPLSEMDMRLLHLFARLQALSIAMLKAIFQEITQENFVPKYFEEKLGGKTIPYVSITLADQSVVHLTGTIDRVDLFREDGQVFVRVIDYKTGATTFSLNRVATGMDMQLVIYLYAATRLDPEHCIPAAAHYLYKEKSKGKLSVSRSGFLLNDPKLLQAINSEENKNLLHGLKLLSREEIAEMIGQVEQNITQIATEILSGKAEKTPSSDACKFCAVQNSCPVAIKEKF